jgi:hypothetical protein
MLARLIRELSDSIQRDSMRIGIKNLETASLLISGLNIIGDD